MCKHGLASAHAASHAARGALDRGVLERLVAEGRSTREIADEVGRGQTTVRHWLREFGLTTQHPARRVNAPSDAGDVVTRICGVHGSTRFVRRSDGNAWRCLRCRAEAVTKRRRLVKEVLVSEAGGSCALCGYDRFTVRCSSTTSTPTRSVRPQRPRRCSLARARPRGGAKVRAAVRELPRRGRGRSR